MSAPTAADQVTTHVPCCSAHGVPMTCARYRLTHFVEVRPCCSADAEALMDLVDDVLDGDQPASPSHPFAAILAGTVDTRPERARRIPEHLRTDDMPSYLAAKGEGTGMRGWS